MTKLQTWVVGSVAVLITATSTIVTILLSISLLVAKLPIGGLGFTAAVINVAAVGCLTILLPLYASRQRGIETPRSPQRRRLILAGMFLAVVAACLTVAWLGWLVGESEIFPGTLLDRRPRGFYIAEFILWAISVVSQAAFYGFILQDRAYIVPAKSAHPPSHSGISPATRDPTPPMHLQPVPRSEERTDTMQSSSFFRASSESGNSWRTSLQQAVRPVSSRTRLIPGNPPLAHDSSTIRSYGASIDRASIEDSFDGWDTSSVDAQARDTVLRSAPPLGLETIPGSRPPSPGHPLDGPFPLQDQPKRGRPPPVMVSRPPSRSSRPPSSSSRTPSRSSRPGSRVVDESHIHPLFRMDSPEPPPTPTGGTIVMASPYGGQSIAGSLLSLGSVRSTSGHSSPNPLAHSKSFDAAEWSGPSAAAPGATTPPIPDRVPSIGPESSRSGRRKHAESFH